MRSVPQAGLRLRRAALLAAALALSGCVAGRQAAGIDSRSQIPTSQSGETLVQQASGQIATTVGKLLDVATAKFLELNAQLHAEVTGVKAEVGNQVAALSSRIDQSQTTTTNQVWPLVIGAFACFLVLLAAFVIIKFLKRSESRIHHSVYEHSYLLEKPMWLRQQAREQEGAKQSC